MQRETKESSRASCKALVRAEAMHDDAANSDGEAETAEPSDFKPPEWTSTELLAGTSEAIIVHAGEVYRLRCTRNNKLILTK